MIKIIIMEGRAEGTRSKSTQGRNLFERQQKLNEMEVLSLYLKTEDIE